MKISLDLSVLLFKLFVTQAIETECSWRWELARHQYTSSILSVSVVFLRESEIMLFHFGYRKLWTEIASCVAKLLTMSKRSFGPQVSMDRSDGGDFGSVKEL